MQTIAPWGDVVMFYKEPGSYNGLYELGQVISEGEYIESIPEGTYIFEKYEVPYTMSMQKKINILFQM